MGFDYLDSATSQEFIRYRGELYDLGEFIRTDIPGWDGVQAHSLEYYIMSLYDRYLVYVAQAESLGWKVKTFDEWLNS